MRKEQEETQNRAKSFCGENLDTKLKNKVFPTNLSPDEGPHLPCRTVPKKSTLRVILGPRVLVYL